MPTSDKHADDLVRHIAKAIETMTINLIDVYIEENKRKRSRAFLLGTTKYTYAINVLNDLKASIIYVNAITEE